MPRRVNRWLAVATVAAVAAAGCSTDQDDVADPTPVCSADIVVAEPLLVANTGQGPQDVTYANNAQVPQAVDCTGMRQFVSQPQPGFSLQSWVFYGHLTATDGTVIAYSTLTQRGPSGLSLPLSSLELGAVTVNAGAGTMLGGIEGVADETIAVSSTSNPWSRRLQTTAAGAAPQFIDARVVQGQLGQPGAIVELTAQVSAIDPADPTTPVPLQVAVRARDVGGVGQWGYGPSGFFPQWLSPQQRDDVTGSFGGSVADYLQATDDPMTNQGSNYYSSPVLAVEAFTITSDGTVIHSGTAGELLADYVTQTYDADGVAVLGAGVSWTEFSVLLDDQRTMKIGTVQTTTGELPYAVMLDASGSRAANRLRSRASGSSTCSSGRALSWRKRRYRSSGVACR